MVVSTVQLEVFLLILARILGIFVQAPILSDKSLSNTFKMSFIFMFTILLWFVIPFNPALMPQQPLTFSFALMSEFFVGFLLATTAKFIFEGVEAAGDLMGAQMGLSVATMLDPATGAQTTVTARLLRWCVIVLFFVVGGHHFILSALVKSYDVLPILHSWNFSLGARQVADMGVNIFAVALQLSAPILLTIFLLDFAFGLISRVAPQVNVFQLGFQIKPALGIFVMMLMTPLLLERILWMINLMVEKLTLAMFYLQ